MNAPLLLLLALLPQAPPRGQAPPPRNPVAYPAPAPLPDGRVSGLNEPVFRVLQAIRQKNPGALTELDALSLKAAILKSEPAKGDAPPLPGIIDPVERDLLEELSSPTFRRIVVTLAGSSTEQVICYSTAGKARERVMETLHPTPNFEAEWLRGPAGFQVIVDDYKNFPARQERIVTFVQGKFAREWVASKLGNGYKPLRDKLSEYYGFSQSPGADTKTGRTLLYKAMLALDKAESDRVPDSLYSWLKS